MRHESLAPRISVKVSSVGLVYNYIVRLFILLFQLKFRLMVVGVQYQNGFNVITPIQITKLIQMVTTVNVVRGNVTTLPQIMEV